MAHWWKGNLHAHSYQSDGEHYPEEIAKQYKDLGYNFLCLSEHVQLGDFTALTRPKIAYPDRTNLAASAALAQYKEHFPDLVLDDGAGITIRLLEDCRVSSEKVIYGYQRFLEEPGKFILIPGEEYTSQAHINLINIRDQVTPNPDFPASPTPTDVLGLFDTVINQIGGDGEGVRNPLTIAIYNHPTYGGPNAFVTPKEFKTLNGVEERESQPFPFFELYNGYVACLQKEGDPFWYGQNSIKFMEAWWDSCLTYLIKWAHKKPLYAIAADDSHCYLDRQLYPNPEPSDEKDAAYRDTPGHGWIMVRAELLEANAICAAMQAGDFYCSTGVELENVKYIKGVSYSILIKAEPGVEYETQFFGGLLDNEDNINVTDGDWENITNGKRTRKLGDPKVGTTAIHYIQGDEIFIRAKVTSTKLKDKFSYPGETEACWVQPVLAKDLPL